MLCLNSIFYNYFVTLILLLFFAVFVTRLFLFLLHCTCNFLYFLFSLFLFHSFYFHIFSFPYLLRILEFIWSHSFQSFRGTFWGAFGCSLRIAFGCTIGCSSPWTIFAVFGHIVCDTSRHTVCCSFPSSFRGLSRCTFYGASCCPLCFISKDHLQHSQWRFLFYVCRALFVAFQCPYFGSLSCIIHSFSYVISHFHFSNRRWQIMFWFSTPKRERFMKNIFFERHKCFVS